MSCILSPHSTLQLYSWLVSRGEAFLQGHQDMGSVLAMARDFYDVHHQLIAELQVCYQNQYSVVAK